MIPARAGAPTNLAQGWARLLVRALVASGARRFVVSPGSRSTPLALAVAANPDAELVVVIDERAAGFVALGMARATGEPAVVICTSGTAAAHLLPAIIEASEAGHPLLAMTADRPWEAHGCGSPQTIDQTRLFGDHVRMFHALGVPEGTADAFGAVARIAAQAVAAALGPRRGPVHVNVPFRKPLEPVALAEPEAWESIAAAVRIPRAHVSRIEPGDAALASLERAVRRARLGVIIAGPRPGAPARAEDASVVRALADATGFPVLADASSGLRFGLGSACAGAFDAILRAPAIADALCPDLIVQLGWSPLSPAIAGWSQRAACPVFVAGGHGWSDPAGVATEMIPGDPIDVARALLARLGTPLAEPPDASWRASFAEAERTAWRAVDAVVASEPSGEGAAVRAAMASVPGDGWLFVGNSRPVRDLDSFVPPSERFVAVLHQRGAAGIDGLVAGAAGASFATARPGVLLLGDVSLAHDLSSLAIVRDVKAPLAIVAIDNGGGRIFDELPVSQDPALDEARDRLFTTPPRIDWASAARAFGIEHVRAEGGAAVSAAIAGAMSRNTATLVIAVVETSLSRGTALPGTPRSRLHAAVRAARVGGRT